MCLCQNEDAPTTSEWSTILYPTKVRLILEVLRCIAHINKHVCGDHLLLASQVMVKLYKLVYLVTKPALTAPGTHKNCCCCHHNRKFLKILFQYNSISCNHIDSNFCTCHDSTAVKSWAKLVTNSSLSYGWKQNEFPFELIKKENNSVQWAHGWISDLSGV